MQATQYGGLRPYAVSLLMGGMDDGPKLFEIEPGASFLGYKADAIGSGKKVATEMLMKEYKENMNFDDAVSLGVKILKKISEDKLNAESIDIGYIRDSDEYQLMTQDELKNYI